MSLGLILLGHISGVCSWWNLYFSYFHSAIQMVACKLEFSLLDFSKGCIYPSTPGPVDVCHLAFLLQAPRWLRGIQTLFEMSAAERLESLLLQVPICPLVYACSISQRDDGWKCIWIYLICPVFYKAPAILHFVQQISRLTLIFPEALAILS